jgi:hypothetical protein
VGVGKIYEVLFVRGHWQGKEQGSEYSMVFAAKLQDAIDYMTTVAKKNLPSSIMINSTEGILQEERLFMDDPFKESLQ